MKERESYLVRARKWIDGTDDLAIEQIEVVIEQFSCRLKNLKMLQPDNKETIEDLQLTIEFLNSYAVKIGGEDVMDGAELNVDNESQVLTFDPSSLVNYSSAEKDKYVTSRNVSMIQEMIKQGIVRRGY